MKLIKWRDKGDNLYNLIVASPDKLVTHADYPEIRAFHVIMRGVKAVRLEAQQVLELTDFRVQKGWYYYGLYATIKDCEPYPHQTLNQMVVRGGYVPCYGIEDYLDAAALKTTMPGLAAQFELWVQDLIRNIAAAAAERQLAVKTERMGYDLFVNEQQIKLLELYAYFALHQDVHLSIGDSGVAFTSHHKPVMTVEEWSRKMRVRMCQSLAGAKATSVIPFGYFRYGDPAKSSRSLFIFITDDGREQMIDILRSEADYLISRGLYPKVGVSQPDENLLVDLSLDWTPLLPKDYARWALAGSMFNLELMALHNVV